MSAPDRGPGAPAIRARGVGKSFASGGREVVALVGELGATGPGDMQAPGWQLHRLRGDRTGFYAVSVSGSWRLVFRFEGRDAADVDYLDYH